MNSFINESQLPVTDKIDSLASIRPVLKVCNSLGLKNLIQIFSKTLTNPKTPLYYQPIKKLFVF
eukprot:EC825495.1.p1 GENE.EC825495.1~~EC825495.1.p1  ORF type:complete len:64 (+),score=11.12 EC825495.1:398-589(+)